MQQQEFPEEQEQQEFEPLPEFGEVEGEKIKLSGLDFSLLQQESAKERKKDLLARIKTKLGQFSHRVPVNENLPKDTKTFQNDEFSKSIQLVSSIKPTINSSTFYLFSLPMNFSPVLPETITRRFGRMHTLPLFIRHDLEQIEVFKKLIVKDDRIKQTKRQRQQQASRIVPELASEGSDSDDIFGKEESEEQQTKKGPIIKIGNKLSLGVKEEDIFGGKRYQQEVQPQEKVLVEKDKYQFLRKKVKPNQQGYEECYINEGPSLQQMRELRKAGVQLFGDAKQYVEKQRKYNVHKDYQKIKRIIDQKSKK